MVTILYNIYFCFLKSNPVENNIKDNCLLCYDKHVNEKLLTNLIFWKVPLKKIERLKEYYNKNFT